MTNSSPTAGTAPDASSLQLELDLFALDSPIVAPQRHGLTSAVARASISPGWWPTVSVLFTEYEDSLEVQECLEVNGELILRLTAPDDPELGPGVRERLLESVAHTCGCCGDGAATPFRARLDGPTRLVCGGCRERLRAGESYLAIADDFFRFDGSRRPWPITREASFFGRPKRKARSFEPLPPEDLRRVIREMHDIISSEVTGQPTAVMQLSLLSALHVSGGLSHGGRALVMGPSGCGKTTAINALRLALAPYSLPFVATDCADLTSPAFSGAPSIADLIEQALDGEPPNSVWASRAVIVLDELHQVAMVSGSTGNSAAHQRDLFASVLAVTGHGSSLHFEGGAEWSSQHALVLGVGAFTGTIDLSRGAVPSIGDITRAGIPLEVASRIALELIILRPLPERELVQLLTRWPALASLSDLCARLGYTVRIHREAFARAARVVQLGHDGSTPRTAGGWLVSALRAALIAALGDDRIRELVVSPDSLPISPTATRPPQPPDEPPGTSGGWDTTIIMTPR